MRIPVDASRRGASQSGREQVIDADTVTSTYQTRPRMVESRRHCGDRCTGGRVPSVLVFAVHVTPWYRGFASVNYSGAYFGPGGKTMNRATVSIQEFLRKAGVDFQLVPHAPA